MRGERPVRKCPNNFFTPFLKQNVFCEVIGGKRKANQDDGEARPKNKRDKRVPAKDEEYYIPYRPKDFNSERG